MVPTSAERADRRRSRQVRSYLRARSSGPSAGEMFRRVAYQLYVTVVVGGLWVAAVVRTLAQPPDVSAAAPGVMTTVVPPVLLGLAVVVTIVGARIGTWAGPVLVSRPEAALLLPAPLDRRVLLRPSLAWGIAAYTAVGAAVGLVAGVVVALEVRAAVAAPVAGTTLAWAGLGAATGGVALWVEASPRLARAALRATPVLVGASAAMVWLSIARPALATWLPPWGWVVAPVTASLDPAVEASWVPVGLTAVVGLVTVVAAARRLPTIPDEELIRRAGTGSGVRASAAMFDARTIAQTRRAGQRRLVGVRRVRLRRPRRRDLLVPWRDLVSILRRRGTVEHTLTTTLGAAVLVTWAHGGPAAIVAALVLASIAVGQLLEPLRIEHEQPILEVFTPLTLVQVGLHHLLVPAAMMASAGALATLVLAIAGVLPWPAVPAALIGGTALAMLLTTTAGLTSTRDAPPVHNLLLMGGTGVVLLIGWLLASPILAVILGLPLGLRVTHMLQQGAPPLTAVAMPTAIALALTAGLAALIHWRLRRHQA